MPGVAQEAPDCFAVDTDAPSLTAALLQLVANSTLTIGGKSDRPRGIGLYVSLHSPEARSDVSPEKMQLVFDAGLGLWLFQHVLYDGWEATAQLGADLGGAARENAISVGYDRNAHVFMDVEGTKSVGQPVVDFIEAWAAEMAKGFPPGMYRGFASGVSAEQAYQVPNVHAYAKAWGPWDVAEVGCVLEQQRQVSICGTYFDPQIVKADLRGRRLSWMIDPSAGGESGAYRAIPPA